MDTWLTMLFILDVLSRSCDYDNSAIQEAKAILRSKASGCIVDCHIGAVSGVMLTDGGRELARELKKSNPKEYQQVEGFIANGGGK